MIKNKYPTTKPSLNLDFANTKSLDPRITFRRGTPGTYYDGVTHVKAEENLLSYSEDFENAYWSNSRVTLTSGQSAPDGSNTAYLIDQSDSDLTSGVVYVDASNYPTRFSGKIGATYTSSVYAKAGGSNYFAIAEEISRDDPSGSGAFTYFYLSGDGQVMLNHENHIASIQNVGNQWYRCSITFVAHKSSDNISMFYISDSGSGNFSTVSPSTNVGASASIYLWGAQLEQRDSVTSYTATNGAPITKYQPKLMTAAADDARFDHDPLTGESKGLLIEEQRTNLIAYSEDFKSSFWNKSWDGTNVGYSNEHIYSDQAVAPDGSVSASKVSPGSDSGVHYVGSGQANILENTTYTISCYLKKGEMDTAIISMWSYANANEGVSFDLTNGVSNASWGGAEILDHSMTHVGNDWYRCTFTVNSGTGTASDSGNLYLYIDSAGSTTPTSYSGNGFDGLYIWGFQVEQATFPTSYIKTTGASATRSADNASIIGENFSSWYRQDEGTLYIESGTAVDINYTPYLGVGLDGEGDDQRFDSIMSYNNNQIIFNNWNGTVVTTGLSINENGVSEKIAAVYKDNDFAMSANGSNVVSDTDGLHYKNMKTLYIGGTPYSGTNRYLGNCIKKISYYPQRLTNEQLQNLTK